MKVELKWITPDAEQMIAHMARVSNPNASPDDPSKKLIKYLIDHKHWSPFEMACVCVEIETTRDIGRQILRHRSFHFQEFSQRYAQVRDDPVFCEPRLQDKKNRQNSIFNFDPYLRDEWQRLQRNVDKATADAYNYALNLGIAKELARKLLPEGMTPTRMYMQGTIRDWIHYLGIRTENGAQFEHQQVARQVELLLLDKIPNIMEAVYDASIIIDPFYSNR